MTKEITLQEACDEINRLNRERDAIRAQVAEAERIIEFKDKVIVGLETRAEAAESAAQRMRGALKDLLEDLEGRQQEGANFNPGLLQCMKNARAAIGEGKDEVREGGGE